MLPRPTNKSMLASIEIGDRFFRFLNECVNEAIISKTPLVKKRIDLQGSHCQLKLQQGRFKQLYLPNRYQHKKGWD